MISGGKTLKLSPQQIARRVGVVEDARSGLDAAGGVLRDEWERVLRSNAPGVPQVRTGTLAGLRGRANEGGVRVTRIPGLSPTVQVGTPSFYGRILHFGVPGRIDPLPHGEVALNGAEKDMNDAYARAARRQ